MKKILAALALACLSVSLFADGDYDKAMELFKKKDYARAIPFLEETITAYPDWFPAVYYKGRCHYHLSKFKEAMVDFNDALTLEVPSDQVPNVKYYLARSYMGMNEFEKALGLFNDLVAITPTARLYDIHSNRAQCQLKMAQSLEKSNANRAITLYSQSTDSFDKAFTSQGSDPKQKKEAGFQKAWSQFRVASLSGSVADLQKAQTYCGAVIKLDNKEQRAHELMISLDFQIISKSEGETRTQYYQQAVPHVEAYLANWPDNLEMLDKKGKALQGAKKYNEALKVFEQLTNKKPTDGSAWFSLGSCQMAAKKYPEAIASLEKAKAKGESRNPSLYTYMAYCHVQQKNDCYSIDIPLYKTAIASLEEGLKTIPNAQLIQKDLADKKAILATLEGNLATDNGNHETVIANINKLNKSLQGNHNTLMKNKDLYLQQPTDELKAAVNEGEKTIAADKEALEKEYQTLEGYLRETAKCGGASTFPKYNEMKALQSQKGK